MTDVKIADMVKTLAEAKETRGVAQKGGKKYTVVADRVEAFRVATNFRFGIVTEIVDYNPTGKSVLIRCEIRDLHNNQMVVASGHAEEWRDDGYVNKTSAVENAETSAIGRALAALGLHGGEFASANEMDVAMTKQEHLQTKKVEVKVPEVKVEAKAETGAVVAKVEKPTHNVPEVKATGWETFYETCVTFLPECTSREMLLEYWGRNAKALEDFKQADLKGFEELRAAFTARRVFLENAKKEASND